MNELYARADQDCDSRINCSASGEEDKTASPSAVVACSRVGSGRRGVVTSPLHSVSLYRGGCRALEGGLEDAEW